ncbi:MAG: amidohydrolase family protein, partial [Anaerolineae bacterium]
MEGKSSLLIRGGRIVTPDEVLEADVLVEEGAIRAVGYDLLRAFSGGESGESEVPDYLEVVDATGLLVLPGVIDAHAHIALDTGIYKTPDDWFTETRAAAYGGVTTVIDFATQFEGQTLREAVEARWEEAALSVIDYALHVMVTHIPWGREDELGVLAELGTTSVKLYTTYRPNYYADDATLYRLMEAAGRYGLLTLVHCENDALVTAQTEALVQEGKTALRYHGVARPVLAEHEATARVLFLADAAGAPVVIAHNSSAGTVALIAAARDGGQVVFSETAPQYLLLDATVYEGSEPWRYILQPPLRAPEEKEPLWEFVSAGVVDMIITDHCDYSRQQKLAHDDFTKTPGGLPGMELLLPLVATYGVGMGR